MSLVEPKMSLVEPLTTLHNATCITLHYKWLTHAIATYTYIYMPSMYATAR